MKLILIILLLLLPIAVNAQDAYTIGISKVGEILYNGSQARKDIEEGFRYGKDKTPIPLVRMLEVILPTLNALREQKLELRFQREF